jgi:hypothetical protein
MPPVHRIKEDELGELERIQKTPLTPAQKKDLKESAARNKALLKSLSE